jgi:hypothetical protein
MSQIGDVRDGIVTRLKTINGLNPVKIEGQNVQVPAAMVGPASVEYHSAMANGLTVLTVPVSVAVSLSDNKAAVAKLEAYMDISGNTSVKAAIEADPTLGGAADDVTVESVGEMFEWSAARDPGTAYLVAEWTVSVLMGAP